MMAEIRQSIFREISKERDKQDKKWGYPQMNTLAQWGNILTEEHGEFIKELNEIDFGRSKEINKFVDELFQVAAVSIAIIEHLWDGHVKRTDDTPKTDEAAIVTGIEGQPLKKIKRLIKPYEITVEVISRYSHFEIYNDDVIVNFIYHEFTPIDDFVFELICKMHDLNHPEKKSSIVPNYQLYGVRYENC
jgi:hypothetical protein